MSKVIKAPGGRRELMMFYGSPGTGKSKAYSDIIRATDNEVYLLDNEDVATRSLPSSVLGRVNSTTTFDWEGIVRGAIVAKNKAKPGDFIIIDMLGPLWNECQSYWLQHTKSISTDELPLLIPKKEDKGPAIDWAEVNNLYTGLLRILKQSKAHVIGVYPEAEVNTSGKWADNMDLQQMFQLEGVRPHGNKRDPHWFHTIIRFSKAGKTHYLTTMKERDLMGVTGPKATRMDWTGKNFAKEYLVDLLGWEVS